MNFSFSSSLKVLLALFLASFLYACGGDDDDEDDIDPDSFSFTDEDDAPLAVYIESDEIEVEGINEEAEIRIVNRDPEKDGQGEYSINGGEWTDEIGEVNDGDEVRVRVFTADTIATEVETTLIITNEEDTFTVRTAEVALSASDAFKALDFSWPVVDGADFFRLFEDATGTGQFVQVGRDIEGDEIGYRLDVAVHRFPWLTALYQLEACTDIECSFTTPIGVAEYMRGSIGYMKASNTEAGDSVGVNDSFGRVAISADGDTLALGAPGEDSAATGFNGDGSDNAADAAGAVYIFVKDDDDEWSFQSYIKASNTEAGDGFGVSVALSGDGNTLIVGAPFEDSAATGVNGVQNNNDMTDAGAAYIFRRQGAAWIQQSYLKASNPGSDDHFGSRVAITPAGSDVAVGATGEDGSAQGIDGANDDAAPDAGAVYIYSQVSDEWIAAAYVKAPNTDAGDAFGGALALSVDGEFLVVGAENEQSNSRVIDSGQDDDSLVDGAGAAYVYRRSASVWSFDTYLKASNTLGGQRFGASVAVSQEGSTIVVGATGEDSSASGVNGDQSDTQNSDSGAAYVYVRGAGDVWTQEAYIKASNGDVDDFFGGVVALNTTGDVLAVGAAGRRQCQSGR